MKEYTVWNLRNGKWAKAHIPNNVCFKTLYTKAEAEEWMERIKKAWQEYEAQWSKITGWTGGNMPTAYRIMSREVTEWKAE